MATWVVGDLQGCWATFRALLDELAFDLTADTLWLVGDLVNRGPRSLDVLRWVVDHDDRVEAVLGNHDLHLLARAEGVGRVKNRDTLERVLAAPDRDDLLRWLQLRPFAVASDDVLMVHAGVVPQWSVGDVLALSDELRGVVADPAIRPELLAALARGQVQLPWSDRLSGVGRWATAAAVLTRIRLCSPEGVMESGFTGRPEDAPEGAVPWFRAPKRRTRDRRTVFGHWSALGLYQGDNVVGLDTGCVWGGPMTAWCVEDHRVVQVAAHD